ncbi:MAG TPA: GNAT family N-acetyltransferase [Blastocatellia bacterium]|nr:GNAT family N-acetyltransferase [Blastocatellia bacterium]
MDLINPGILKDEVLLVVLDRYLDSDPERECLPTYHFNMVNESTGAVMGAINLRIGNTYRIPLYRGHVGYRVEPEYRGNHLAARSVRLLIPLAGKHQINPLWITCNSDNIASRRSCELAGGELIEIIDIPPDEEMYQRGIRRKCRYRFNTA